MSQGTRWDRVGKIWEIIDQLRGEPGCPWDRKQTPLTVQTYLLEEAHEAASAVRGGNAGEAAEELGDLLFMVLFLIHLYEEQGDFTLEDTCELISQKMIRRHPHVFGHLKVESASEVRDNWEKIKAEEKSASGKEESHVPESLPALMRAHRMLSRLSKEEGSPWDDAEACAARLKELGTTLFESMAEGLDFSPDLLGAFLIEVANLGRLRGIRAEDSLHKALRLLKKKS